ncbi:MAG: archease [Candidatus Diapherotrites archaeon]
MAFEWFDHQADIGVRGLGKSYEEAFAEAAHAMFSLIANLETVKADKGIEVKVKGNELDELLVNWLNELLYLKDSQGMVFKEFHVKRIYQKNGYFHIDAVALGEKIDYKKHDLKSDVKAATYSELKVEEMKGVFYAQCVVDV